MTRTNTTTAWALVAVLLTVIPAAGQTDTAAEKGLRIAQENERANATYRRGCHRVPQDACEPKLVNVNRPPQVPADHALLPFNQGLEVGQVLFCYWHWLPQSYPRTHVKAQRRRLDSACTSLPSKPLCMKGPGSPKGPRRPSETI